MTCNKPQEKPAPQDWHKADIKAALEKAGFTLRGLARSKGMSPNYFVYCLAVPSPKAQALLAQAIGLPPQDIWPSRYEPDGSPRRGLCTKTALGRPLIGKARGGYRPRTAQSLDGASTKANPQV